MPGNIETIRCVQRKKKRDGTVQTLLNINSVNNLAVST